MNTKVIKLDQAEQMMTYLEIDKEERRILVRFADGKEGWVPVEEIEKLTQGKGLDMDAVELPNPYEINIGGPGEKPVTVPWDFARHYCDQTYREKEIAKRDEGRSILGRRVVSVRKERGMTQEELSEAADVGRVTISRIENGEQSPRHNTLKRIAQVLGVDLGRFIKSNSRQH